MSELLLVEAALASADVRVDSLSRWAAGFHDELDSRGGPTPADRRRLVSWLRVQSVGRETVTVTEPRISTYAGFWTDAARAAGLTTRLMTATGELRQPEPVAPLAAQRLSSAPTFDLDNRRLTRCRTWLLDRAEAAGRVAVRAIQR